MIAKCEHGNYIVAGMTFSYACTGCRSDMDKTVKIKWPRKKRESDETLKQPCPICTSNELHYEDENNFFCPKCGCDQFTIL